MTYAELAARKAETIANVREYEMEERVTVSVYAGCQIKIAEGLE